MNCNLKIYLNILIIFLLFLTSCSTGKKAVVKQKDTPKSEQVVKPVKVHKLRSKLVKESKTWLGTPYVYAKAEKGEGTDCSGMVMKVYLEVLDVKIPRNSAKQAEYCQKIKRKDAQPGDLVFFATGKNPERVSHVGILVDDESFIHASSSKGVVISRMDNPWYAKRLLMFGRVPQLDELLSYRYNRDITMTIINMV